MFEDVAADNEWTRAKQIAVLLEFIESQELEDECAIFAQKIANEDEEPY